jgi:hypothetical protein
VKVAAKPTPRVAPATPCAGLEHAARRWLETEGRLGEVERAMAEVREHYGDRAISECLYVARALAEKLPGSTVVGGYAAWRVGMGDGDVVVHHPSVGGYAPSGAVLAGAMHAWVELGPVIIDATTYTLAKKLHELDRLDGRRSLCLWAPQGLVTAHSKATLHNVRQGYQAGAYYYERDDNVLQNIDALCAGGFKHAVGDMTVFVLGGA